MNLTFSKIIKLALLVFIALIFILIFIYYTQNPKGLFNMNFFLEKDELIEISNERFSPEGRETVIVKASGTGCSVELLYTESPDFNAVLLSSDALNVNPLEVAFDGKSVVLTVTQTKVIGIAFNYRTALTLYIPRSYAENLYISTSSGSVAAEENFTFKNLSIESASGSIKTGDLSVAGALMLASSSGSLKSAGISAGSAEFSTASGGMNMDNATITGNFSAHSNSGSIRAENISARAVKLSAVSGGIHTGDVESGSEFSAETTSGSIKTGDITASSTSVSSVSGGLTLGIVNSPALFKSKSTSGSTKIDSVISESIECTGTSGGIKIGYAEGILSVSTSSGGVTVEDIKGFGAFKTTSASIKTGFASVTGDLSFQSSSGSITVSLPGDASLNGKFHTSSGSFKSDFAFDKLDRANYAFMIGGGAYSLTASTASGGMKITLG